MNQKSSDDIQSLKDKVRYLQEENDNLKCKLKFCEEFTNVRTWIDQLIAKQKANKQLSSSSESSSDVIATVSKIDEPPRNCSEAAKLESKIDLENPLFIEAQFPITEKVIDSIPSKNKKSDKRFVAALLRLMYPEEYLATHTMGANLTGKPSMDEKELTQIIDQTLIYFNYIKLPKNEKDEKISVIRKAITTTLNNIKQKNRKK
ncbi:BEN domain-containing protein 6-like [Daphnia magna]|nr:BEN domain-containing protein 6-like [Daphnia magna]XP_045033873.1 BEN domain-containing protein 6-like [Daphnia magna]